MRCAKCSSPITESTRICDSCGAIINTSSTLRLGERLRPTNNTGAHSPTTSPSNSGTLKIGARLRLLSQKNEEPEEPNPFAIPKKSPSQKEAPQKSPSNEASNENPFSFKGEKVATSNEAENPFLPKKASSQENPPATKPRVFAPQPAISPFEVPVLHSPFETPSMQNLLSEITLPPELAMPEKPTESTAHASQPSKPLSISTPSTKPPVLPPLPKNGTKKDLRAIIQERAVRISPSGEATTNLTGLKPPTPIQAKPGLSVPPVPSKPAPPVSAAPTPSPESPITPKATASESIELDDFAIEFEDERSPQKAAPPALDELEAIADQIDSLSTKLETIKPDQEPTLYPLNATKTPSDPINPAQVVDEFSVALQTVVPTEDKDENPFRTPPHQQNIHPELSEHSLLALSIDKATSAVDDLFGDLINSSSTPLEGQPSNLPQETQSVSIELDEADMVVEKPQPPQGSISNPFELEEVDMVVEKPRPPQGSISNPFELEEEDLVIDSQGGSAISSLAERAASYRKGQHWKALTEVLKEIATRTQEPFQLWVEIAELQWEKLQDQTLAFASYQKALMLQPKNEKFLEKLLSRYFDAGRWDEGFEIIERIGILAPSANERSKRFHGAALVLHQKYQQSDIALELFNEALDIDVQVLEAFEQIDRILTKRRDWSLLEQNYRRMVLRVPDSQQALLVMLWHNLGEIYRTRLSMMRQAADAFEEACRLDPNNPTRQKILAEIYATDPSQWERTAEHERRVLATGVDKQRSLHSLFGIYLRAGQKDRAFCAAAVLVSMGVSTQEEEAFYANGRGVVPRIPSLPITDAAFRRYIAPKEEDSSLSAIFRLISPYAVVLYARTEKESGLNKKERVELSSERFPFLRSLQEITKLLQLPTPAVYTNPNPSPEEPLNTGLDIEPLLLEKVFVPGVIAGPAALSPRREVDALFLLTKHLVYLRPEYIFIRLCHVNQGLLKILLRAAIYIANSSIPLPKEEEEEIMLIAKRLSKEVPAAVIGQIKLTVDEAIRGGNDFSTTRWMTQVELACGRAALVICGDLEAATRMIQSDTTPLSVLAAKAKLHDLHMYIISEEYSALRHELKIVWPHSK
jgi:tetratricopeptide (TPR) repeat protein